MRKPVILFDPTILGGKPVIGGTRIAVVTIIDLLAAGLTIEEIRKEYPQLSRQQIQAAISFAASRVKRDRVLPIEVKGKQVTFQTR